MTDISENFLALTTGYIVAATLIGPDGDESALDGKAAQITASIKARAAAAANAPEPSKVKSFVGTIVKVEKEASSTRGVITFKTGTTRTSKDWRDKTTPLPSGYEQARTDRTDDSSGGKEVATKCVELRGHRVRVTVHIEPIKGNPDGHGVRIVKTVDDLGVDPDFQS